MSGARVSILTAIMSREENTFTARWLGRKLTFMTPQAINHHLRTLRDEGVIQSHGNGLYTFKSRQILTEAMEVSLESSTVRSVMPTHYLSDSHARDLNVLAKQNAALVAIGHPLGNARRKFIINEINKTVTELKQAVTLANATKMSRKQGHAYLDTIEPGKVQGWIELFFPETQQEMLELYNSLRTSAAVQEFK